MMKVRYTDHALERLKQIGISKKEVEEALTRGKKENAEDDLRKSTYKSKKGTLIVIYNIENTEEVGIITAYWN